jgi:ArsR family transcriptional regulator, virulence genes transcriptional regulator
MKQERLFELHAEVCKTLSNAVRLRIISELQDQEMTVGTLAKKLGIRQAHLSQHLSILRQRGVVAARKDGLNVYYSIANPKIIKAYQLIREVLMERLQKDQTILASISSIKWSFCRCSKILSPIEEKKYRSSIILFKARKKKPADIVQELEKRKKIIVSARGNGIRVSSHFYNNEDDIDKLITSLKRILQ